jgi:hypothetical protein
MFSSQNPNRIFSVTQFRIWLAYELGSSVTVCSMLKSVEPLP